MNTLFGDSNNNITMNHLNELQEHFTKFENEVWNYNSLRPNEAFKIDLTLPHLVIEMFAKLFRLWRDFTAFQKLIEAELFHKINNDMNAYFGTDVNQFEFYCDTCDKNIAVVRNDLKYSYELHSRDEHHQQVLNHFNYLISTRSNSCMKNNSSAREVIEETNNNINGYVIIYDDNLLKCSLCDKPLVDEQEAVRHVISWSHRLKEMSFNHKDTNYIVEIDKKYYCRLCQCEVMDKKKSRADHLSSEAHKILERCQKVLRKNAGRVMLLNKDLGEFLCESCGVKGANWKALLEHCQSSNHLDRPKRASTSSVIAKPDGNEDFILFSNGHYECVLCSKSLKSWEIVEHKQNKEHMEKSLAFVRNDEALLMSPTTSLNSSTESDGYNDAFKNNDIYIEINLQEDDSEIYKCILCNKTGKGLDNLDTHCLTPTHQKHKKHIEKISRIFANNETNGESMSVIKDLDDIFYCEVCDVLIEDDESVREHTKEKAHVQSELVQKVLSENGTCVSLVTEDPVKLYHCQLCSRHIDGDNNIVGHGTSSRHTQLLNAVKELSRNRFLRTVE